METNRLRQFCAVAETLNLREASEILGITHGGLFKSLKVLEAELGYSLFQKSGRGIVLTEKGRSFYPKAVQFLHHFNELLEQDEDLIEDLRIGSFEVFTTYFFSHELATEFAGQSVLLRELLPGEMERSVLQDEIDVAITYEPIPMKGLNILEIGKFTMGLYAKKACFKGVPFAEIPFVVPALPIHSNISGVKGLDGWPDDKAPRNQVYKVDMLETALHLCSQGRAMGHFPEFLVSYYNQTRARSLQLSPYKHAEKVKPVERSVYLVIKDSREESREVKKIAKNLRKICR